MNIIESEIVPLIATYFWVLLRVGTLFMVMPIFSSKNIPRQVKLAFVIVMSWALLPTVPEAPQINYIGLEFILISVQQLIIGAMMGMVMQIIFNAVILGSQGISTSLGLSFATMIDPANGVNVPVLGQLIIILATLLFLTTDGHLVMIDLLAQSFKTLPIGFTGVAREDYLELAHWVSKAFAGGLALALPTMGAIITVNLGFGVITKAAPQISIFTVGLPLTMLLGFIIIWVTIPSMLNQFLHMVDDGVKIINAIIIAKE